MSKPAPKPKRGFNLLKSYIPPLTGWDRIYEWLIGKARVVMIVAEIIIAIAFLAKVAVDTQAKNYADDIKAQNAELTNLSVQIEPGIRTVQNKVLAYQELWRSSTKYADILAEVYNYIPNAGSNLIVTVSEKEVTITGDESFAVLSQIEARMKASPTFATVSVPQVTVGRTNDNNSGQYTLTAVLNRVNRPPL